MLVKVAMTSASMVRATWRAAAAMAPALVPSGSGRLASVWALRKIGPKTDELVKDAVPVLAAGLKNPRDFVRIEAAMALGDMGKAATDALPSLEAARRDPSAAVRSAAQAAIEKISG